jgi:hypothetical protein
MPTLTTLSPQDGSYPDANAQSIGYHYPISGETYTGAIHLPNWWLLEYFGNLNHSANERDSYGNTLLSDFEGGINPVTGLPDSWLLNYFGNLNHTANDLDSGGVNTLGYDYANGLDPNVITFSIETANNYVNTTSVNVQLDIVGGTPFYYAVLVNDTNPADADWQAYTGPNLTVPLGATDGVYDVFVGLKGLPSDATQTWNDYSITLDRVAPVLTITNPVIASGTATVIKPYLQLQGFANEQLSSLSYDISNAVGIAVNQDAFVTDKAFDTNTFNFTTNWFQAYDVPLTNGVNNLTLHATDLAGNVTTTNFNVVLDYSTATNPPVVTLIWPTDGMAVSGTTCTMRGTMSDETGTIVAQIVDGDGNTNTVNGIVERNGMFWLENVPLNGVNQVSVQATDAAGNVTTTNFMVNPATLTLTIDSTPTGDALYQGYGTVGGTVGDPSAAVTVNGVTASVDGGGNWSAADVPIYGKGTATFDAKASTAGGQKAAVNASPEMGPYVAIVYYAGLETQHYSSPDYSSDYNVAKSMLAGPTADSSGHWVMNDLRTSDTYSYESYDEGGPLSYNEDYTWSVSQPSLDFEHFDNSYGAIYNGSPYWPSDPTLYDVLTSIPHTDQTGGCATCGPGYQSTWVSHYFANKVHWNWKEDGDATENVNIDAKTQVKLYTGGKAQVARENLFCLNAWATEYGEPPGDYGGDLYPWWDTPGFYVDPATLTVGQLGSPGSDGNLWVVLPDNAEPDITVTDPGKQHYDAWATPQIIQPTLSMISVDASDPANVVVTYCLETNGVVCNDIVAPAHFVAPGVDIKKLVSGTFTFTFDQHNLSKDDESPNNYLNLEVDTRPQKCVSSCKVSVTSHSVSKESIAFCRVPVQEDGFFRNCACSNNSRANRKLFLHFILCALLGENIMGWQ